MLTTKEIIKEIGGLFKKNNRSYEFDVNDDGVCNIYVIWGDWKHDHLFIRNIMMENGYEFVREQVTLEDGSDAYSAIHTYKKKGD